MTTKVQLKRWGNSQGIRIPKEVLDLLNLPADAEFDLEINHEERAIILQINNSLTPYQRLIKNKRKEDAIHFKWDQAGSELI